MQQIIYSPEIILISSYSFFSGIFHDMLKKLISTYPYEEIIFFPLLLISPNPIDCQHFFSLKICKQKHINQGK